MTIVEKVEAEIDSVGTGHLNNVRSRSGASVARLSSDVVFSVLGIDDIHRSSVLVYNDERADNSYEGNSQLEFKSHLTRRDSMLKSRIADDTYTSCKFQVCCTDYQSAMSMRSMYERVHVPGGKLVCAVWDARLAQRQVLYTLAVGLLISDVKT